MNGKPGEEVTVNWKSLWGFHDCRQKTKEGKRNANTHKVLRQTFLLSNEHLYG